MPENSPIQIVVNSFVKGEVSDLDPTMQSNEFFESAENIRIMNHQGHGLVITNIKGNSYSISGNSSKGFQLTDGFVPIGGCVYNGVLFIASCYKTRVDNEDYAIGEIGSYPSISSSTGNFTRVYQPLQNWDEDGSGNPGDLRTAYLKFHIDKPIDMVPWETADGSVNLYIADGDEPLRVINSGFNFEGDVNDIVYTADHFPNAVNLVMSSNKSLVVRHQNTTDSFVQPGGSLPYGNMFFFFRYADSNLNYTHFLAESRPCQIYDGEATVGGSGGSLEGKSDKKVNFNLYNVDQSFAYVQVGYIRYFSGEDGQVVFSTGMVDREYPIPSVVSSGMDIEITGTEGSRVLDINELVANRDIDDTCETIIPIEDRLWGANWTSITHHHDSMASFALLITVAVDVTKEVDATVYSPTEALSLNVGEYKVSDLTSDYVGYFRGETYPFAIRCELNNGYLSAPYPITGKDFWKTGNPTNEYGIVRFPVGTATGYEVFDTDVVRLMAISFDLSVALQTALDDNVNYAWFKENVRAIHIVRGERKKTLEYQGLGVLGCTPRILKTETDNFGITQACSIGTSVDHVFHGGYDGDTYYGQYLQDYADTARQDEYWGAEKKLIDTDGNPDEELIRDDVVMPLFRAYAPMHYSGRSTIQIGANKNTRNRNYMVRWFTKRDKLAVFSPDLMMGGPRVLPEVKRLISQVKTLPTRTQWTTSMPSAYDKWTISHDAWTGYSDVYPNAYAAELVNPTVVGTKDETNFSSVTLLRRDVWHTPQTANDFFANRTKDLYSSDIDAMHYAVVNLHQWTNRAITIADYIGITLDASSQTEDDNYNLDIINLYNRLSPETEDITSYFSNISTLEYHKIGDQILTVCDALKELADLEDYEEIVRYSGDCFIQRTYFKLQSWPGTSFNAEGYDSEDPESEGLYDLIDGADEGDYERSARFSHGVLVSIITENALNLAMRSTDKLKSYYPKVSNKKVMAITPDIKERGESYLLNNGYSHVLSPVAAFGYSSVYPTSDKRKRARIRFSDVNSSESFIDGFRNFRLNNYRDFSVNKGPIKKLIDYYGYLVSIQEKAINMHYINERQMRNDPDSGDIVFGTGEVLSPKWRTLADYGSQHKTSICKGLSAVYGVDFYRRKIWKMDLAQQGPAVIDLGKELYNSKNIQELFDRWSLRGDIVQKLPDTPMSHYGLVTTYDPKYGDIYFIFVNQEETSPQGLIYQAE